MQSSSTLYMRNFFVPPFSIFKSVSAIGVFVVSELVPTYPLTTNIAKLKCFYFPPIEQWIISTVLFYFKVFAPYSPGPIFYWVAVVHRAKGNEQKYLYASVAVPSAPVRVLSQWPLAYIELLAHFLPLLATVDDISEILNKNHY